jgi:hypothetical protein
MPVKQFPHISGARLLAAGLIALASLAAHSPLSAQFDVPVGGATIDFDNTITGVNNGRYNGTAPNANPAPGDLDSRAFAFQLGPTFRGGATFGASLGNGQVDGVYGFIGGQPGSLGTGHELGFVPPNGTASTFGSFSLTTTNGTGSAINQLTLQLDFNYFNGTSRGVTLNVSYTIAGVTTALSALTFSPTNALGTIAGTHLSSGLVTLGTTVPNAGQIIFNFTLTTNGPGAGNIHDEVGIDNISLSEGFVPEPGTYAAGAMALGVIGVALRRRWRA